MDAARLRKLLAGGESDRVEFTTSSPARTDKFAEAACAFANDLPAHGRPGFIVFGVHDSGSPAGWTVSDRLLRRLAGLRSNVSLEPIPSLAVHKVALPEGDVAVVEVQPADFPPVRYRGRVWVRVGPTRRVATRQEEQILTERRAFGLATFDLRPAVGSSIEDLAEDLFRIGYLPHAVSADVLLENDRGVEEQLASLRFFDLRHGCPTHAAVLLFAQDPLRWVPGAWIQFVQWAGTTLASEPIRSRTVSGDLLTVLREVDLLASLPTDARPVPETTLRERHERLYPKAAIRELLLNAVMHRLYESTAPVRLNWFTDRLEIQNPGGLYGIAPADFPHRTGYRNPVIAEAMATLGYVNRFGRGVLAAQAALRANGNPDAEFQFDPAHILVTVRARR